ncbi:MAG TPA: 3',5'-cyclic-nucleotide phosphodiesterase [Candidatus Manganitrophaceae bacterium]|nr:3',5'-cyclic-nucleotide phosphodiesterase [Candidatus Manganitrophaceae bacterium]
MRVRVLGCYGADFYEKEKRRSKRYNPSGFLLNQSVVLDAGTICGALTLPELAKIRYVFLSHAHMDHIQSLPFLAEILFGKIQSPIVIVGIDEVVAVLKKHFFNDALWPDFTRLPTPEHPILRYQTIEIGKPMQVEGLEVTAIRVSHIVPTVGFIIEDDRSAMVYSGDTWETEEIWKAASRTDRLKAVFIESSFPDQLSMLAKITGHLTPGITHREFKKIKRPALPLYVYHMKPPYLAEIKKQVRELKNKNIHLLRDGQVIEL